MKELFSNSTRKVLIFIAITICVAFLFGIFTKQVTLSEQNFMQIALIVLGAFFATKSNPSDPTMGGMK